MVGRAQRVARPPLLTKPGYMCPHMRAWLYRWSRCGAGLVKPSDSCTCHDHHRLQQARSAAHPLKPARMLSNTAGRPHPLMLTAAGPDAFGGLLEGGGPVLVGRQHHA